ncbi:MAG: NRDE family protein [Planctomycetota bacterium]|jgi:hypothetical protein|nr:NRDE family protein [Planctomycetota bacterium]
MCVLIVCRDIDPDYPVILAANREEDPSRPTSPPGLHAVADRCALYPQDKRHGGTWIGINDSGIAVALTNVAGAPVPEAAHSRGLAVLQALAAGSVDEALDNVRGFMAREVVRPLQLVVADGARLAYFRRAGDDEACFDIEDLAVVLTNRHPPKTVEIGGLSGWVAVQAEQGSDVEVRLDHLVVTLATAHGIDMKTGERFPVCVEEGTQRTVSSTLLAVPRAGGDLRLRYCAGSPRTERFRDYSGLGARL